MSSDNNVQKSIVDWQHMVMQAEYKVLRQRAKVKAMKAALKNSPMDENLFRDYQHASAILKNLKQVAKHMFQDYDLHSAIFNHQIAHSIN